MVRLQSYQALVRDPLGDCFPTAFRRLAPARKSVRTVKPPSLSTSLFFGITFNASCSSLSLLIKDIAYSLSY